MTFRFPKVKWLYLTGEVDKCVRCSCKLFSEFRLIFDRVNQKIKRWTSFGTVYTADLLLFRCSSSLHFQQDRTTFKTAPSLGGIWTPTQHSVPRAYLSSQPKRHLDCFSCFPTIDNILSIYFTIGRDMSPQNCPFLSGDQDPDLMHGSLGPSESTTQPASQSVQPF